MAHAGVHERGDRGIGAARALAGLPQGAFEPVQRFAAGRGIAGAAWAVHQLVGRAHERIDGVHGRAHIGGEPTRGPVVGGVVVAVDPPAGGIGSPELRRHLLATHASVHAAHAGRIAHRRGETARMRNRQLHDALRAFALEAAAMLRDDQAAGQELEFDLDEGNRRGGPALYHYRPLTAKYIAERWNRLRFLPSAAEAAEALDCGASAYLRLNGMRGAEAEPALRAMLERLYDELSDFAFPEERFERVYTEVEGTLYEKSQAATVLVPVHGLEIAVRPGRPGRRPEPGARRPHRRPRRGRVGRPLRPGR